jgi:hypothetical protein
MDILVAAAAKLLRLLVDKVEMGVRMSLLYSSTVYLDCSKLSQESLPLAREWPYSLVHDTIRIYVLGTTAQRFIIQNDYKFLKSDIVE